LSKDPAVLFYTADFLVGTQFFSDDQVGKYMRCLCQQHQRGHLSSEIFSSISKGDASVCSKFLQDSDGNWFNERMDVEINRRKKYSESRANNRKGNISSTHDNHMSNTSTSYDRHMETETETENETVIVKSLSESEQKGKVSTRPAENPLFEDARKLYPGTKRGHATEWAGFAKHRDHAECLPLLVPAIEAEKASKDAARLAGGFCPEWPHFSTWINQRRWEQEIAGPQLPPTLEERARAAGYIE
jgi:hypothetical protein